MHNLTHLPQSKILGTIRTINLLALSVEHNCVITHAQGRASPQTSAFGSFQGPGLGSVKLSDLLPQARPTKTQADPTSSQSLGTTASLLKSDSQAVPPLSEAKLKLQALNLTSSNSNATAHAGPLQPKSSFVPISAGWSSLFKSQLSAAANKFHNHAQTAASAASSQASRVLNTTSWLSNGAPVPLPAKQQGAALQKAFPWNAHMVEKKICTDSCDKAVRPHMPHFLPDHTKYTLLVLHPHTQPMRKHSAVWVGACLLSGPNKHSKGKTFAHLL